MILAIERIEEVLEFVKTLPQYQDDISLREMVGAAETQVAEIYHTEVCTSCAPDCDYCEEKNVKRRFEAAVWELRAALKKTEELLPMVEKPKPLDLGALKK